MFNRISRAVVALLAAFSIPATMLAASAPASADSSSPLNTSVPFDIANAQLGPNNTHMCIGVVNGNPELEPCNGGPTQEWQAISVPNDSLNELIRNVGDGGCLSIAGNSTSEGAQVNKFTCDFSGRDPFELWHAVSVSGRPGDEIANKGDVDTDGNHAGLVMHPSGCATTAGSRIFVNDPDQCLADFWILTAR